MRDAKNLRWQSTKWAGLAAGAHRAEKSYLRSFNASAKAVSDLLQLFDVTTRSIQGKRQAYMTQQS